jgi:hypothetical protein
MRSSAPGLLLAAAVLLAGAAGCDSTGVGGGPAIVISATWNVVGNEEHRITFRSPDDGKSVGLIAGTEHHPSCPRECDFCDRLCPLGGHWANGRIEITLDRPGERPKFTATFHAEPQQLVFYEVGGSRTFTLIP